MGRAKSAQQKRKSSQGGLPLSMREANLARLLARRPDGIFLSDFEQGEIGPDMFVAARLSNSSLSISRNPELTHR